MELVTRVLRDRLNRSALTYAASAAVLNELGDRLLARLGWMKITPQRILCCGMATPYLYRRLCAQYPETQIVALDLSPQRLGLGQREERLQGLSVCGEYDLLPFERASFDMMIAPMALPFIPVSHLDRTWGEWSELLRPQGLLLFSTVGPDTFKEWRATCQREHQVTSVHDFLDMHEVGDQLLRQG